MAAVGAAALALTACSGDGSAGSPEEAVAQGLQARFEEGASWSLSIDGDLDAIAEQVGEPAPPEAEALFNQGLVTGAISPDGGFAMTLGPDEGFFELRAVEEAVYVRLDLQALRDFAPEASTDIPDPQELQGQLSSLGLPPTLQMTAETALQGGWIGITGLTQEALQSFAEDFGGTMGGSAGVPSGEEASEAAEDVRAILEEEGLLDGQELTDQYLQVSGEGPEYDVTVLARALVETLERVNTEIQDSLGPMADTGEVPAPEDVPEEISGFTVTVEDGAATEISGDLAALAESMGENTGDVSEGDVTVRLQLDDVGDQLQVPSDATTIAFEELIQAAMGAMFSGSMS